MKSQRRSIPLIRSITLALGLVFATAGTAFADLTIDFNQASIQPIPIAIPAFTGGAGSDQQSGRDIAQVVSADLERSGLFTPIDPRAYIQLVTDTRTEPRFGDWRLINAQGLVTGDVVAQGDGRLKVDFRLWDVVQGQQLTGYAYTTTPQNWRRIAHIIADAIYKRVTGESGYFDTRIVYVAESGPVTHRQKRLAIMDQDGANHRFLTDGRSLVLTPRFSPTRQEITYMSYASGTPRVYLFNIDTGQQEMLGDFPGMTYAPRFSPDGDKVIMSLASGGTSAIYSFDLRTRHAVQITDKTAIDTSPCYSPDGTKIVFNSDRGGSQQLYTMNADGSNIQRISHGEGNYGTPVWSPRGDLIAFTKIDASSFYIGVMKPDGSGERLLTNGFLVEGPTWAPNGRVLMFFRQNPGGPRGDAVRLYSIDLTGRNEREVITPQDGSDPAWSPLGSP